VPLRLVDSRSDNADEPWLVTVFVRQDVFVVQLRRQVKHSHLLSDVVLPDVFVYDAVV